MLSYLRRNRQLMVGMGMILVLLLFAIIGRLAWDTSLASPLAGPANLQPSPEHPLGTDRQGRDLLAVMIVATPLTLYIGLLAGLVAPKDFDQVSKSNTRIARAQIDALEKALDQYRLDMGTYPTSDQGLQALVAKPNGAERWQGPYLKKAVPPDPWGHPYRYRGPGEHGDYDLYSLGADDQPGGTGENIDVASWEVATAKAQ